MQDNKPTYTKLSDLVGGTFTVQKAYGFTWKRWNNEAKRMEISETYAEGFRKIYTLETDKGKLDLGSGQLGNLLEITYKNGAADVNDKTFAVKSNGKTGMDIRYFFSVVKPEQVKDNLPYDGSPEIKLEDIPF